MSRHLEDNVAAERKRPDDLLSDWVPLLLEVLESLNPLPKILDLASRIGERPPDVAFVVPYVDPLTLKQAFDEDWILNTVLKSDRRRQVVLRRTQREHEFEVDFARAVSLLEPCGDFIRIVVGITANLSQAWQIKQLIELQNDFVSRKKKASMLLGTNFGEDADKAVELLIRMFQATFDSTEELKQLSDAQSLVLRCLSNRAIGDQQKNWLSEAEDRVNSMERRFPSASLRLANQIRERVNVLPGAVAAANVSTLEHAQYLVNTQTRFLVTKGPYEGWVGRVVGVSSDQQTNLQLALGTVDSLRWDLVTIPESTFSELVEAKDIKVWQSSHRSQNLIPDNIYDELPRMEADAAKQVCATNRLQYYVDETVYLFDDEFLVQLGSPEIGALRRLRSLIFAHGLRADKNRHRGRSARALILTNSGRHLLVVNDRAARASMHMRSLHALVVQQPNSPRPHTRDSGQPLWYLLPNSAAVSAIILESELRAGRAAIVPVCCKNNLFRQISLLNGGASAAVPLEEALCAQIDSLSSCLKPGGIERIGVTGSKPEEGITFDNQTVDIVLREDGNGPNALERIKEF